MTDVEITLNATANDADIKKFIIIDEVGDIEEAANYVGMEIVLAIKGTRRIQRRFRLISKPILNVLLVMLLSYKVDC
ncbi:hypothetical protein [Psychrobacter sp. WY6]|uniref:hypothetical protein n=1 Tax=Psychrobacter sp. WY6 TaxID=2708350 RepID=UPI002022FE35|nr:hypothetical protein [Psychrobacter sp. WY6]